MHHVHLVNPGRQDELEHITHMSESSVAIRQDNDSIPELINFITGSTFFPHLESTSYIIEREKEISDHFSFLLNDENQWKIKT